MAETIKKFYTAEEAQARLNLKLDKEGSLTDSTYRIGQSQTDTESFEIIAHTDASESCIRVYHDAIVIKTSDSNIIDLERDKFQYNNSLVLTASYITDTTSTNESLKILSSKAVQTLLNTKVNNSQLGAAGGVATLDSNGKLTDTQIPDALLGQVKYCGVLFPLTAMGATATQFTHIKGTAQFLEIAQDAGLDTDEGNVSVDDLLTLIENATYAKEFQGCYFIAGSSDSGTITNGTLYSSGQAIDITQISTGDWIILSGIANNSIDTTYAQKVDNTDAVKSVNGKTGAVELSKADVGLSDAIMGTLSDGLIPIATGENRVRPSKFLARNIITKPNGTNFDGGKIAITVPPISYDNTGGIAESFYSVSTSSSLASGQTTIIPTSSAVYSYVSSQVDEVKANMIKASISDGLTTGGIVSLTFASVE